MEVHFDFFVPPNSLVFQVSLYFMFLYPKLRSVSVGLPEHRFFDDGEGWETEDPVKFRSGVIVREDGGLKNPQRYYVGVRKSEPVSGEEGL